MTVENDSGFWFGLTPAGVRLGAEVARIMKAAGL
jgi:hypothetical protein